MPARIVVSPEIPETHDLRALTFDRFLEGAGKIAARSRSSDTVATAIAGVDLYVKRYRYSGRQAFRGMLRNTLLGRSRVRAEFETIARIRGRLGDVAPRAVAFGEARTAGFLRRAFLATEAIPDARPVGPDVDPDALGGFLRRLHDAGVSHGRLYARNLLVTPDGALRFVDLDRASVTDGPVEARRAAIDLACLLVSLDGIDEAGLFDAYGEPPPELESERARAAAGLARRSGPPHI